MYPYPNKLMTKIIRILKDKRGIITLITFSLLNITRNQMKVSNFAYRI